MRGDFVGELYEQHCVLSGYSGVKHSEGSEAVYDGQATLAQLHSAGARERELVL